MSLQQSPRKTTFIIIITAQFAAGPNIGRNLSRWFRKLDRIVITSFNPASVPNKLAAGRPLGALVSHWLSVSDVLIAMN
ncbi:hypothetical protein J6590_026389 [Homalodisca vitripennis]|nr:hypothetical protein J6590_026389 [Homalodisca vitripennis]